MDLQESAEARALIETTIGMARRLGLKVTAEGIESLAVFNELRFKGSHEAKGYFISKAMPADEVPHFADCLADGQDPIEAGTPHGRQGRHRPIDADGILTGARAKRHGVPESNGELSLELAGSCLP